MYRILSMFIIFSVAFVLVYPETDALEIIRKMDEMQKVDTAKSEISMIVFPDADDEDTKREFRILSYGKGEETSYMSFQTPRSIKGLSILSVEGDQWIFFPSTGRVRKIAEKSKDKSVQGVGGDFSYEDMSGGKMEEKYNFTIAEDDKESWTLEGVAKKEKSVYSKIKVYVLKEKYLPTKIEYYKEKYGHYKDLIFEEYKDINGHETATEMTMMNHKKNSKTMIIMHKAEYDVKIDEKYFNPMRFYK
ncbi:outer membrane lipoprotein-sorting protein [Spirochaetota bacterium]